MSAIKVTATHSDIIYILGAWLGSPDQDGFCCCVGHQLALGSSLILKLHQLVSGTSVNGTTLLMPDHAPTEWQAICRGLNPTDHAGFGR
jgi:hypothetical protein